MSKPSTAPKVEVVRNKEGEGGSSSVWCVTGVVHTEEFNNDEESQGVVEKPFVLNAVAVIHEMAVSAFYAKVIAMTASDHMVVRVEVISVKWCARVDAT